MVLLLSSASMATDPYRQEVYDEWFPFYQMAKKIYPLLLNDCTVDRRFVARNYIDARTDIPSALDELLEQVRQDFNLPKSNLRALELAYLDRLQDEERLNHERQTQLYTHLSGKAQKRRPEVRAAYERRSAREGQTQEPKQINNAIEEILAMRQAALLGEPGSGKTTTIWLLAVNLLEAAKQNPKAPIPLLIRLGRWTDAEQTLPAFIAAQLGELGAHLDSLLKDKHLRKSYQVF